MRHIKAIGLALILVAVLVYLTVTKWHSINQTPDLFRENANNEAPQHNPSANKPETQFSYPPTHPFEEEYKYPYYVDNICNDFPYRIQQPRNFTLPVSSKGVIKIFVWRQQVYNDGNIEWDKLTDMCPFPPELQQFFNNYRKHHVGESIVWKDGYAPCWLWNHNQENNKLYTCENNLHYTLTTNYTEFRDADILYLDYPFYDHSELVPYWKIEMMPPRLAHQRWVFKYGRESIRNYPYVSLHSYLQQFDFTLGSPEELFDLSYPLQEITEEYALELANIAPSLPFDTTPTNYIAWMVRNCQPSNNRNEILMELIDKIDGHSYGKCHHNKDVPKEILDKFKDYPANWNWIKNNTLGQYPFTLVIENSNCIGYVTEKIYDALSSGAIPVYLGASNIESYVPRNSFIDLRKFASIDDLITHMKTVDRSIYYPWKDEVKKDVTKFCKSCFKPKQPIECMVLDYAQFAQDEKILPSTMDSMNDSVNSGLNE